MPKFPVSFGRRKSVAAEDQLGEASAPSFRVLERPDYATHGSVKSFDGGVRLAKATGNLPKTSISELSINEDNLFAGLKTNRGSGSSNTTKTTSTDNSSRHSNASTTPSSTDLPGQEEWRNSGRKQLQDISQPPAQKSGGFLKQARTFSFGGNKKSLPSIPAEEQPPVPTLEYAPATPNGRSRAQTASSASTTATATPPKLEDRDFMQDLGGDFSNMLSKFNKRSSVLTIRDDNAQNGTPRSLTGRSNQPSPLHLDNKAPIEPPPHSWTSQRSNEGLLGKSPSPRYASPANENAPPPVPAHGTFAGGRQGQDSVRGTGVPYGRQPSEEEENVGLLKDSMAASRFLSGGGSSNNTSTARYRRDDDTLGRLPQARKPSSRFDPKPEEDNLFDVSFSRPQQRYNARSITARQTSQTQSKVMTPEEFERYRQDKERRDTENNEGQEDSDDEDPINYDDEEDEHEKAREQAKQRRKQEAHMAVYRQQMMKVTGEGSNPSSQSRPSLANSMSAPNLLSQQQPETPPSDGSEEDEEVPLAILAAHGFPNKNRPPTRLANVGSNPNLRATMAEQQAYPQRPGSSMGLGNNNAAQSGGNPRLPAFARNLPKDPFLGAGLINQPPRESFAMGGGAPAAPSGSVHPGGLVGVIANEERSRAMRRGSPNVDKNTALPSMNSPVNGGFDPMAGIPPQMMYPMAMPPMMPPMLTPGDQAQIQMTQQMQQFMQMQMQFMQMMATQGQGGNRPASHLPNMSMTDLPRNSMAGDPMGMGMNMNMMGNMGNMSNGMDMGMMGGGMRPESVRGETAMRTMSMVQPSSASWIQQPQAGGYAPSIRVQGAGYAPSIAPSERSNIGLPGRYRPVSQMPGLDTSSRTNTMSGAISTSLLPKSATEPRMRSVTPDDDDDDEQGWEAMKAKRDKKKTIWKSKKSFGGDIGALIS